MPYSEKRGFGQPFLTGSETHGGYATPSSAPPRGNGRTYARRQLGTYRRRTTTGHTPRSSQAPQTPSCTTPPRVSATYLINMGSEPTATAQLPCTDELNDAATPTPAEENDAADPRGADPPGGTEVGPTAMCALERGTEITQTPERAPPMGVKQGTSGPAALGWPLYASLCLRFWSEFRGIPPGQPPVSPSNSRP